MASSGRKKPRTKESKPPVARVGSGTANTAIIHQSLSIPVDDAGVSASTDTPYVCTGRFGVDFVQLCRRAHLTYIPNVVARAHRPIPAPVVEEKRSTAAGGTGKVTSRTRSSVQITSQRKSMSDPFLAPDAIEGVIPEPPPKTYVLRDSISFFRPSVQVSPFVLL